MVHETAFVLYIGHKTVPISEEDIWGGQDFGGSWTKYSWFPGAVIWACLIRKRNEWREPILLCLMCLQFCFCHSLLFPGDAGWSSEEIELCLAHQQHCFWPTLGPPGSKIRWFLFNTPPFKEWVYAATSLARQWFFISLRAVGNLALGGKGLLRSRRQNN